MHLTRAAHRPFHAQDSALVRELKLALPDGFATAAARAAWHNAGLALAAGRTLDVAALCDAGGEVATVLELQHRVLEALRRSADQGFLAVLGGAGEGPPADMRALLWSATEVVLTRILKPPQAETVVAETAASSEAAEKIDALMRQSHWLQEAAEHTAGCASQVSEDCGNVLQASAMAFVGINTNADISQELERSIESISEQLARTADASVEASNAADGASTEIGQLKEAAARIGHVTELIRRIAGQTNLLALNATIEAARAGEAGRGFAVVASEVKALAKQTSEATGQIGKVIEEIRVAVAAAAARVQGIQRATSQVRQLTEAGAEAVERQRSATAEISTASADAARAVAQMQEGIEQVATDCFSLTTAIAELTSGAEIMTAKVGLLAQVA